MRIAGHSSPAPTCFHRGGQALFVLTLAPGKFGGGLPQSLHGGSVGKNLDGLLKGFQVVDGEQNRRGPAVDGNGDALMLGADEGDQFRETRFDLSEGGDLDHWS